MREFFVNRPDTAAMERLLGSHASDAAGVAVRLAWQAGLLRDEITNLTWDQVDFERNQLQLPARTIPITQMLADYLRSVYRKWTFLTGNSTNNCVICSDRYHKQMQPQCGATSFLRNSDKIYEKKRNASQAPGRRFWPSAAARTRTRSWRPLWTRWWPPGSLIVRSVGWRWTTRPTPCDCYCSKWGGM